MRRSLVRFGVVGAVAAILVVGAVWLYATGTSEVPVSAAVHSIRMLYDQKVAMRDGVKLSTDLYLPRAEGKFPTIVIRTPYDNNAEGNVQDAVYFAERGYAVALQDSRGRYDSEGEWVPLFNEGKDGYDTIEWAAAQPWSTGKIGTYGASYLGITQWFTATFNPPHLTAMFPIVAYSDFYHNWIYTGGSFLLAYDLRWALNMATRTRQSQYMWFNAPNHIADLYWHLPLITADEAAGHKVAFYKEWIRHPNYDEYWKSVSIRDKYDRINAPAYMWQGWFDVFLPGTTDNYIGMTAKGKSPQARRGQKMLVGPWIHQARGSVTGDVDFGPQADLDRRPVAVRWFDYWLKGTDNGIMNEPPVRIFVMGDNVWRDEREWPLARTRFTNYYFHSAGKANSMMGDGTLTSSPPGGSQPTDQYVYDPKNPVPTLGGATCCGEATVPVPMGPRDQRVSGRRDDVLVYQSPVLEEDVEVTGPVEVTLYASSSAPDTDFTAKLIDVSQSGFAMNLTDGLLRGRFRNSFEKPEPMTPGTVYPFRIDLKSTSNVFKKGHRIRVEISSSNFPRFDRNPNTGHPLGMDAELREARQTIYHDATRASHIRLPIIPRASARTTTAR